LRFGVQFPELLMQRKLVSAEYHAQNCGSYSFYTRIQILTEMYCSHQFLIPKKSLPRPL